MSNGPRADRQFDGELPIVSSQREEPPLAAAVREVTPIGRDRRFFQEQTRYGKACDRLRRPTIRRYPIDIAMIGLHV